MTTGKKGSGPKHVGDNSWLGNIGITSATIQEIDDTVTPPRWKSLGTCVDAPNAITQELSKEQYQGHTVWIRDVFGDRKYHGTVR